MMNLAEYRRTSSRLADFLPWAALAGEGIVLNKNGSFQRATAGIPFPRRWLLLVGSYWACLK